MPAFGVVVGDITGRHGAFPDLGAAIWGGGENADKLEVEEIGFKKAMHFD